VTGGFLFFSTAWPQQAQGAGHASGTETLRLP